MTEQVIILNVSNEVLCTIEWERAVTMVVAGQAEVYTAEPDRFIRSQHLIIPFPRVVRLNRYVYVGFISQDHSDRTTLHSILVRDKRSCGYCGKHAATIDHIFPRSRGGLNTWDNMIACCFRCNNFKADRTPEEAGMKLLWEPKAPKQDQQYIWNDTDTKVTA